MNAAVACGPADFYFTTFSNPLDHFLIENQFFTIRGSLEQEIARASTPARSTTAIKTLYSGCSVLISSSWLRRRNTKRLGKAGVRPYSFTVTLNGSTGRSTEARTSQWRRIHQRTCSSPGLPSKPSGNRMPAAGARLHPLQGAFDK